MSRAGWVAVLLGVALGVVGSAHAQSSWRPVSQTIAPLRARVDALPAGTTSQRSLRYLLDRAERRAHGGRTQAPDPWLARAVRYLARAEAGEDPYVTEARGQITLRAYRTALSTTDAGYAVYIPPDYDPSRRYPLLLALHGGSSNGNLFLGLTLGATVPFERYREHWDDLFTPARTPEWIVVAPDGFGNSMWRFQGERDVLDTLEDTMTHYAVDPERVVLHGLSNGGLGSYNIGLRHAWRFSAVVPAAGAPGWLEYLGGRPRRAERRALLPLSGSSLLDHTRLTHLHVHHGHRDPGPMRPRYAEALAEQLRGRGLPHAMDWYATGHDLVGPVHRDDRIFEHEHATRRTPRPAEVIVHTGDFRAARQHWLEITGIEGYPRMASARGEVHEARVVVRTAHATALTLHLRSAPVPEGPLHVDVDGSAVALRGPRGRVRLVRTPAGWVRGVPPVDRKRPGLSGPIFDAYYERMVHVYGSLDPSAESTLRQAAEAGARGWFGTLMGLHQEVVRDRDVTAEQLTRAHLVLYGNPSNHGLLAACRGLLPIEADRSGITNRGTRHPGRHLGARFIYPSPLAPNRYVVVATGTDADAVLAGDRLPAFLPDWVLYDPRRVAPRRTQLAGRHPLLASGYFDDRWR